MCGILGTFTQSSPKHLAWLNERLQSALQALHHRGPDDRGLESHEIFGATLSLGHTRLSIIDLSPGGHQPMHSHDGRFIIIFNGEIYNYRELRQALKELGHQFRSNSDTEVLLSCWMAWGADCLPRLRGMFAFAVFDRRTHTLTLARDAFGIKPLYYHVDNQGLSFASELQALLTITPPKPELNLKSAYKYLAWGHYDNQQETFLEGIYHLLPGHLLTVDLTNPTSIDSLRWWWPSITERSDLTFEQATEQLREMFLNNIRLHLRSDVPVGAALSGGVDSSAVVCAMRHIEPDMPIHTFSYVARGSSVDEERWADLVNAHARTIPHKVIVTANDLATDLDDMVSTQGEPFGGTSIYAQYRVFQLARQLGIVVTLDGQGADELLAGYHGYPESRICSLIERREFGEFIKFATQWPKWPGRSPLKIPKSLIPDGDFKRAANQMLVRHRSPWLKKSWFERIGLIHIQPLSPKTDEGFGRRLAEKLRYELSSNGLSPLLRHGDRNSMRWSIESRVPFLTQDMAEFLLTLPEHYLLSTTGETKSIFRAAMRGIVPNAILDRRDKIGFQTPEQVWLRELGPTLLNWIEEAENLPFIDAEICRAKVTELIKQKSGIRSQYWRLINYCRWVQLISA